MPNWAYNILTVTGDVKTLKSMKDQVSKPYCTFHGESKYDARTKTWEAVMDTAGCICESPLSFWNIIKPSDDILAVYHSPATTEAKNNKDNWYNWNIKHWGTKWDACDVDIIESNKSITYRFKTAWCAPIRAIDALASQYNNLVFKLVCDYEGGEPRDTIRWKSGKQASKPASILLSEYLVNK